ncbi:MAG: heme-copper oxidase subunit III [Chloroflexi bacterium]|nr:heme-copper oxidase subunit III [Chloroflexota bacterium]
MASHPGRSADGPRESHGSYWPIVLAATLTVTVAGLIVHPAVSALGLVLSVVAMVAWSVQRFQAPSPVQTAPTEGVHLLATNGNAAEYEVLVHDSSNSGRWGLIWFISTEAVFFANMIAAYLYLRARTETWPPPGGPHLELLFPGINTVVLLLSGVPAYYAHQAIKKDDRRGMQVGLILAALLGAIFLGGQVFEYLKATFGLQTNTFAAGFFVLTGFHGAHVFAGIGLLLAAFVLSLRGRYSSRSNFAVEVVTTYWHFVDVVWVFLFTILYLFS